MYKAILAVGFFAWITFGSEVQKQDKESITKEKNKRNIESIKKMYRVKETQLNTLSKDIVWHGSGHNPVSGLYQGYPEHTKGMPSPAPLKKWKFKLKNVMVNGDYVVATFIVNGERKNKKIKMKGAHLLRLNDQGQVVEGWEFTKDQDVLDDFFAD